MGLNPKVIQFKKADNSIVKYSLKDIKKFNAFNHSKYFLYVGKISMGASQLTELSPTIDSSYRIDSVFLKSLINGNKTTLSVYRDRLKDRFFISYKDTTTELLSYDYLYDSRPINFAVYKEQLRNISKELGLDLIVVETNLTHLKYNKSGLIRFIEATDRAEQTDVISPNRIPSLTFFAGVNTGSEKLKFEGDHFLAGSSNSTNHLLPGIEIGLSIYANPRIRKLIFRNVFSLDNRRYQLSDENEVSPGRFMLSKYEHRTHDLAFTTSLALNIYNSANFKFYLGGGFRTNYSAVKENRYSTQITRSFAEQEQDNKPSESSLPLSKIWFGIPLETGFSYRNGDLFFRYTKAIQGIDTGRLLYKIDNRILSLGFRYNFVTKQK